MQHAGEQIHAQFLELREREDIWITCLFGVIDAAKHVANMCAQSSLSSFGFADRGNRQSSFASGCSLPGVLQAPLQPVCHCHSFFFILKIQPQNERGLDKFLEFKNSDQY
jgi:hypothetical protein